MSFSTTYNGLKTEIVSMVEDESDELAANLDTIIALAETKCLRDLDLEFFQERITGSALTANTQVLARPSGVIKVNGLWLTQPSGAMKWCPRRTEAYCIANFPNPATTAYPKMYSDRDETDMAFYATPDAPYPVTFYGIKRPPGLATGNQTTWLSNYAGDLLLYACLVTSEEFLSNPEQVGIWKGEYDNDRLPKAKLELRGLGRASYELYRPSGQPGPVIL